MKLFAKFGLGLSMLVMGLSLINIGSASALFEDSKKEACSGATLKEATTQCDATAATSLSQILANVINLLSVIISVVAVIVIIISGFRYVTSGGDSGRLTSAKNSLVYAIVGLILVALAQVIVKFVLTKATKP
jgi:hypothetical protein